MGIISSTLNPTFKKSLALARSSSSDSASISIKATPTVVRVAPEELEQVYISDPVCFNSINKGTQMIMAANFSLLGDTDNYFENFLNNIGSVGEPITFTELLEAIFKYQMLYGNAYVELVFDKRTDSRVVDLFLMDPKRVDYAKDSSKKIALDKYGRPVGYTLKVPYGESTSNRGDTIPKEYENKVSLDNNQLFLLPKRVCHFKLYTYGDRFYGLGLIEPGYKSTLYKGNIEKAQANAIYQRGNYPIVAGVGDPEHEPTPQDITDSLDQLVKLKFNRYTAFPYWVKPFVLETKQSEVVNDTLEYLRLNQTASLGMPVPFATGAGEKTNRATLTNQQKFLEFTLYDIVNKTLSTIRKYIFKPICFYNHIKEVPSMKWGDIQAEERNEKAKRITSYVNAGIINPSEAKEFVKKSEGLT